MDWRAPSSLRGLGTRLLSSVLGATLPVLIGAFLMALPVRSDWAEAAAPVSGAAFFWTLVSSAVAVSVLALPALLLTALCSFLTRCSPLRRRVLVCVLAPAAVVGLVVFLFCAVLTLFSSALPGILVSALTSSLLTALSGVLALLAEGLLTGRRHPQDGADG